jgi:hypothetical protein
MAIGAIEALSRTVVAVAEDGLEYVPAGGRASIRFKLVTDVA